ncbi:MAG: TonB-dependent receptor, partial [Saprospiraceae bacterium]|nr:TonB-dependent receptor [Pyrinomonadaceae bacterium]
MSTCYAELRVELRNTTAPASLEIDLPVIDRTAFRSAGLLQGTITDSNQQAVVNADVRAENTETGISRSLQTDEEGFYQFAAISVGTYRVTTRLLGFSTQIVENVVIEVGRSAVLNFELRIGDISEEVRIESSIALVELNNVSVGQVINERTVQEIPLNGRYFIDLGLLIPGSVTPPQNGFLSPPTRGGGSLALNTAGNREDTVNFQINGITLNDQVNNILNFNPPLASIKEFKIDNSTFSAEYGRNSGAIVNVATRSGTQDLHGEFYEFFRNDALDARNFFNFTSASPPPFKRNQFGGAVGGPVMIPRFGDGGPAFWSGRERTFFFFTYERLRQRQEVDLNTLVLSDAQRTSVVDPVIRRLIEFIPRPNFFDSSGAPRFVGSARATADVDQWTIDISHNISANDRLHGYYAYQDAVRTEPTLQGTTIPGFGDVRLGLRQILTLNETHIFSPNLINEARFGFNRISFTAKPVFELNPSTLGINIGVNDAIGLPQINIAGGFNFGGPSRLPQGRKDTTIVLADTLNYLRGRHSLKFGGEYRVFYNNGFTGDTGAVNFPSIAAFIAGNANSFSIILGDRVNKIKQTSFGMFVQDSFKWRPNFTFDLGFRYDLNLAPKESEDRFIVFDPATASLLRVGRDIDQPYRSNYTNLQPRVGFAWDPFKNGKTSVRAAYGIFVEQPMTNAVTNTAANPPLASPLSFTGAIRLDNAITLATAAGLS